MIEIDIPMPSCCDECFALDDHGDYPYCLISHDQRGYTFNTLANRMPSCPLKELEPVIVSTKGWVCSKCGAIYGPNFVLPALQTTDASHLYILREAVQWEK